MRVWNVCRILMNVCIPSTLDLFSPLPHKPHVNIHTKKQKQRVEQGGFDPSGRYLVACLSDSSLRLYDLEERQRKQQTAGAEVSVCVSLPVSEYVCASMPRFPPPIHTTLTHIPTTTTIAAAPDRHPSLLLPPKRASRLLPLLHRGDRGDALPRSQGPTAREWSQQQCASPPAVRASVYDCVRV